MSLIQIPFSNSGGNIAHLGGAFYGLYYANNFNSFTSPFDSFTNYLKRFSIKSNNNKKFVEVIETELGNLLSSFLVDNFQDRRVLDRMARSVGVNITIITSKYLERLVFTHLIDTLK